MTLTPEQIEAQRVKFESVHPVPKNIYWYGTDYYKYDQVDYLYDALYYRNLFRCWLSCVESNEIELPRPFIQFDSACAIYVSDLISSIQAQGFKVKA